MVALRTILVLCLAFGLTAAEERRKRQAYDGNYNGAAQYRQPQGYQQQPQGYQQQPQGYQQQQAYGHQPAQQYAPQQQAHKPPRQQHGGAPEEEKEQGPHPLNLLLENSKFECGSKSDGYYADSGVGCQAFHYCVSGQKHSMMCPAGTVFHQVHLNCVPQDQDICNKADKFYFVNDYLNKALEQKGPNNTVQYAHRYYPENYAVGDPFVPPQEAKKEAPAATYGLGPAYREQQAAPAHQGAYHPQNAYAQQAPAHHQQPAAYQPAQGHRPQNPAPYTPQSSQAYQHRPAPAHQPARPAHQQNQLYGYGAEQAQAYNAQAQQAQRAYAQQQYQAAAPPQQQQQHLYGAGAGQRPRYA